MWGEVKVVQDELLDGGTDKRKTGGEKGSGSTDIVSWQKWDAANVTLCVVSA